MPKAVRAKKTRTHFSTKAGPFEEPAFDDDDGGDVGGAGVVAVAPATKKLRREERHARLMEKLSRDAAEDKAKKEKAKRDTKTPLGSLSDALPSLADLIASSGARKSKKSKKKASTAPLVGPQSEVKVRSSKGRKHAAVSESAQMQQVLQHSAFRKDALSAIRQHLSTSLGAL